MNIDVSVDSQPMPSALPHTDQGEPAAGRDAADLRLPTARECPFDPPAEYKRLRDEDPVSRLAFPDGSYGWLLSRYEDVRSVLGDPRSSSHLALGANPIREVPPEVLDLMEVRPGQFIAMDPPEHTRYRRLLTGQFTVRRMNALTPRIEQIVADHLDAMGDMTKPVDLVEAFALPVPSLVICEMLGVPYADRAQFQRRSRALLTITTDGPTLVQVRNEMDQYMLDLVQAKRLQPAEDLLSGLIAREDAEGALTDEELVHIGNMLLIAGHETTANMLALGTLALLEHPEQLAALCADPSLIDQAVEELLRYLTIVQFGLMRAASEDFEVGSQSIRAGETIVASLAAANRDPQHFPEPDELDLSRQYSPHLAFGHGVHQCLGQQLARMEMKVGFRALLERFPSLRLAVPVEQVRMRDETFIYGVHELPVTWDGDGPTHEMPCQHR
jgi:cytochrome P450